MQSDANDSPEKNSSLQRPMRRGVESKGSRMLDHQVTNHQLGSSSITQNLKKHGIFWIFRERARRLGEGKNNFQYKITIQIIVNYFSSK
jgi:hypothetical protein